MRTILLFFLASVLFGIPHSVAETDTSAGGKHSPASLKEIIDLARKRNPEMASARKDWDAARARIAVARGIPDLEFGVEFEGIDRNSLDLGSSQATMYRVGQTIPFPSKLLYRSRAASFQSQSTEERYHSVERDILARVKETYYALMFADRAVQISQENVEILRKFARIAANRYAVGKTSQSDVLRAQVELSKANNMVVTIEQEFRSVQARLNSLLDRKPHEPFGEFEEPVALPLPKSYEELEAVAFERRPEVREARYEVQKTGAEVGAMKSEYLPDFMLEYTWRNMDLAPNDSSFLFKVNVPLWFWRQNGQVGAAQSESARAREMLRTAQATTRSEVQEFMVHVDTARRLVELYRTTLLPQAEQSLRVAEAAYQSDRIDFLNLLDSDRTLIDFRLEYFRNLAEYGKNSAHLERVLGVDLADLHGGKQ